MSILFISLSLAIILSESSCQLDYYWRDYHPDKIPEDAVIGGKHANGENAYIGRGYLTSKGLIPFQINKGAEKAYAFWGYYPIESKYNQILCGRLQNRFKWLLVNTTHLSVLISGRQPVIGGHTDVTDCNPLLIGRVYYHGETKIGKINACEVNNASFYFLDLDYGIGQTANMFEVLYFDAPSTI